MIDDFDSQNPLLSGSPLLKADGKDVFLTELHSSPFLDIGMFSDFSLQDCDFFNFTDTTVVPKKPIQSRLERRMAPGLHWAYEL
jgi:hypothetical protein